MVESNSNRFRSPSVFKTVQGPALITFHDLEHRVGFEPTVLRICNPLHWATLPPVHKLFGDPGWI